MTTRQHPPPELLTRLRFVVRDDTLPHQIVLLKEGVSCNCRRNRRGGHDTFAPLGDAPACWAAYNDPANHTGTDHPP